MEEQSVCASNKFEWQTPRACKWHRRNRHSYLVQVLCVIFNLVVLTCGSPSGVLEAALALVQVTLPSC